MTTLEKWLRANASGIRARAMQLSHNYHDAEDLAAETARRALARWADYEPSRPFAAWFFTIMRNYWLDSQKRYDRRHLSIDSPTEGGLMFADVLPIPESPARADNVRAVRSAISRLRPKIRAAITMVYLDGMKYDEAAKVLRVPAGTIRSRVSRGLTVFRKTLKEV